MRRIAKAASVRRYMAMFGNRVLKLLAVTLAVLVSVYAAASAFLYVAMRQRPERFGAIMSHVPMVAMMILPFKPLWMSARAGQLKVGDPAPDFALPALNKGPVVKLSERWRERPLVLIFGSYT